MERGGKLSLAAAIAARLPPAQHVKIVMAHEPCWTAARCQKRDAIVDIYPHKALDFVTRGMPASRTHQDITQLSLSRPICPIQTDSRMTTWHETMEL